MSGFVCVWNGCEKPVLPASRVGFLATVSISRAMCGAHYQQFKREHPNYSESIERICSVCKKELGDGRRLSLCEWHAILAKTNYQMCDEDSCLHPAAGSDSKQQRQSPKARLCLSHYSEKYEHGSYEWFVNCLPNRYAPRPSGYVWLYFIGGLKMAEHRFVVAQRMRRLLLPHETVHHKNGIRHDNRPENLEYWPTSHGKGQRAEDMLEHHKQRVRELEADLGSVAA